MSLAALAMARHRLRSVTENHKATKSSKITKE